MRTLVNLSVALLYSVLALFRSREEQAIVEQPSVSSSLSTPMIGRGRD